MKQGTMVRRVSCVAMLFLMSIFIWIVGPRGDRGVVLATHGFPHATVKVWNTEPFLGFNPAESVEDPAGLTGHGTLSPTIVTVYQGTTHPGGPCGVSYWNPDLDIFVDYGKTKGVSPTGVDMNKAGPPLPVPGGPLGAFFGPGDTWMSGQMSEPLYMQLAGTDFFRSYLVENTWGVDVDETTGNVFFTQPQLNAIARLNPATNVVDQWLVKGNPAYVTVDIAGRPYATLSLSDAIVRVNPGADGLLGTGDDTATFWTVPSVPFTDPKDFVTVPGPFQTPNGLTIDANGNIWFDESNSNEIGRLSGERMGSSERQTMKSANSPRKGSTTRNRLPAPAPLRCCKCSSLREGEIPSAS